MGKALEVFFVRMKKSVTVWAARGKRSQIIQEEEATTPQQQWTRQTTFGQLEGCSSGNNTSETLTSIARAWKLRLERDSNGTMMYTGGLVSNIDGVNVDKCNMLLIEASILDLVYMSPNVIY
ncbi:hypothetical protein PIB30_078409 [Stylosanthes scabra]|uniref:Uncharacterized protein n=1 Tax=Stylosanthes scabra TaxID=79078 RepID=A0ABU6YQA7_9FABA|nr:hypothetical protein [Stylosanthes scabra]